MPTISHNTGYPVPRVNVPPPVRSPSLSPGVFAILAKKLPPEGGTASQALRAAQRAVERMAEARDRMDAFKAETRADQVFAEDAKVARIAQESDNIAAEVDAAVQSQIATVSAAKSSLEGKIEAALYNPDFDDPVGAVLAQEIRGHLKSMTDPSDRLRFVNDALAKNDHRTLSAVLAAPAYLSGFHDDAFTRLRAQTAQKLVPDVVEQLEVVEQIEAKVAWAAHAFAEEHKREAKTPRALAMTEKFAGKMAAMRDPNRIEIT